MSWILRSRVCLCKGNSIQVSKMVKRKIFNTYLFYSQLVESKVPLPMQNVIRNNGNSIWLHMAKNPFIRSTLGVSLI